MQTKGNVPPSALAGLSAEDVQELAQPYPPKTDPATYQEYVLHPRANPVQWLTQNATKFDPKTFDMLLKKALSVNQQTTPGSVSPVSLDKQQIDTTLQQNFRANLVFAFVILRCAQDDKGLGESSLVHRENFHVRFHGNSTDDHGPECR